MKALAPIKGIANSIAIALNDSDVVVGSSINSTFTTVTATIWKNGVPADLNTLIPANSSLYLHLWLLDQFPRADPWIGDKSSRHRLSRI